MTAIVAVKSKDGVYMGGDRAATTEWGNTIVVNSPKVIKKNGVLIGTCGDFRSAQIIEHLVEIPKLNHKEEEKDWCVRKFIPTLIESFQENNYEEDEWGLLVCPQKRVFKIYPDFAAIESVRSYISIGDGEQFCDGVLSILGTENPKDSIEKALEAAEMNCGSVLRPFDIEKANG